MTKARKPTEPSYLNSSENKENSLIYLRKLKRSLNWARKNKINVIPLIFREKKPVTKWKQYREQLSTPFERNFWFLLGLLRNIGFLGGSISNNLCIFDIDNEALAKALFPRFPPTTTVLTSNNKRHYYYRTKDPIKSQRFEFVPQSLEVPTTISDPKLYRKQIEKQIIGVDIKAEGAYVVAPPSIHPSGAQYKFITNEKITTIDFNWAIDQVYLEIINLGLKQYIPTKSSSKKTSIIKMKYTSRNHSSDTQIQKLIDLLPPLEVMVGFQGNGSHPVHGSDTGINLSIDAEKQLWYCFRHNSGGGRLEWFMVQEGLISCSEAKKGGIDNYGEALRLLKRRSMRGSVKLEK